MASSGGNRNTWIIAGAIVLAGSLVMIGILAVNGNDDQPQAHGTPTVAPPTDEPSQTPRPHRSRSPRPTPSESPSPTPTPTPTPTQDPVVVLRAQTQKQAERDRPGEVQHIGQVDFFDDPEGCPQSGQAASVYVRYTTQPKFAIYTWCKARAHWKLNDGPIYGE